MIAVISVLCILEFSVMFMESVKLQPVQTFEGSFGLMMSSCEQPGVTETQCYAIHSKFAYGGRHLAFLWEDAFLVFSEILAEYLKH